MAKPLVFLSWSTESSHKMAVALSEWIPLVLPTTDAFMSSLDLGMGSFWDATIREKLATACFGVICVTADNLERPWLNYEAGALAERLGGRTSPYC